MASSIKPLTIFVVGLTVASQVFACGVPASEKAQARKAFCERSREYPLPDRSGCLADQLKRRLTDSHVQAALARLCSNNDFATFVEQSLAKKATVLNKLHACIDTPIDFASIHDGAAKEAKAQVARNAPPGCPKELRDKLAERIPILRQIEEQDEKVLPMLIERLGL